MVAEEELQSETLPDFKVFLIGLAFQEQKQINITKSGMLLPPISNIIQL
jgi:hypothetical protein